MSCPSDLFSFKLADLCDPCVSGAEIVKTLLMHLFVRAIARLVALRIAVVWRIAFVDTTAAEKGKSIHGLFHWEQAAKRATIVLC